MLNAHDPDTIERIRSNVNLEMKGGAMDDIEAAIKTQHAKLVDDAVAAFHNPELRESLVDIRKKYDQIIDAVNMDSITKIGWVKDQAEAAKNTINDFVAWIESHKDEITALQIFYAQDYRRRDFSYKMIKELCEKLKTEKPLLAPINVWNAYEQLEKTYGSAKNELVALVSLIRKVCNDATLTSYDKTVDKNFQDWVFKKQAGNLKFTEEQMQWLRMIKDYVANSFQIEKDDFDLNPFNAEGGLSKMWKLFGEKTDDIIDELNAALAA